MCNTKNRAIQMIGTQRSGSNLFRVMLNELKEVVAPHPPHILQRFSPLLPIYGDLNINSNFYKLIDDVCTLVELNPVKWEGLELNRNLLFDSCTNRSLVSLFYAIYGQCADVHNADYWVCKSMANINFTNSFEKLNSKPNYIHLYRDGRDVACSFKKVIVGEKHIYHLAKKWKSDQEKCLILLQQIPAQRFHSISYENLTQNTAREMKNICQFLGIPDKADINNFHQSKESQLTATAGEMWSNVSKPVMTSNSNKFKKLLSKEEIIIFEHVAGEILKKLGYELEFPTEARNLILTKEMLEDFNKQNDHLEREAKVNFDLEGQRLRKGQEELIAKIKEQELIYNWNKPEKYACRKVS